MKSQNASRVSLASMFRVALLVLGLSTYLVSADDVVWRFIKHAQHARLLEHFAFGFAAVLLGVALLLKIQASTVQASSSATTTIASLFQAVGIGCLLPLPGFLLLVIGDLGVTLLLRKRKSAERKGLHPPQSSLKEALVEHTGLCCAFLSMTVFGIVLVDRVADLLFALSAIFSLFVSLRRTLWVGRRRR